MAEKLQWSIAKVTRRRRGYWSIMANVQHELDLFNDEFDQPMDTIPRKSYMQKLGRYDLAKGLERNGGAKVVRSRALHVPCTVHLWRSLWIA